MSDCIIIGGGIIGLMTALELKNANLSVVLMERGELGQESSWAGGGILSPLQPWTESPCLNQLVAWGRRQYPALIKDLFQSTGVDPELLNSGMMFTDLSDDSMHLAVNWAKQENMMFKLADAKGLLAFEPHLNINATKQALVLPGVSTVRNPRLLRALRQHVMQKGVEIHCQTEAQLVFDNASEKASVLTKKETLEAAHVIVAAGAWSSQILKENKIDITPVKGQMLLFHPNKPILNHVVVDADQYLIPRGDGRILAGSTVEFCGFDQKTTASAATELKYRAEGLLPALKKVDIERHWAGLRPGTHRKTPYIGRHPQYRNLYLNTGHFRNGFSLAPASARLLSDLVLQRNPIVNPAPFAIHSNGLSE